MVNGKSNIPIPKNENIENPKNYTSVTCLPTIYKLITSIIAGVCKNMWIMKFWCQKSRNCAAAYHKDAKISC